MFSSEVLWVQKLEYEKNWGIKSHSHDFYQMYFILNGSATIKLNGKEILLNTDDLVLFKPFEEHELLKLKEGSMRMLDIKFKINDVSIEECLKPIEFPIKFDEESVKRAFEKLRLEWKCSDLLSKEMCEVHLNEIIYSIIRGKEVIAKVFDAKNENSVPEDNINLYFYGISRDISKFLQENYKKSLTLDEIAVELKYNKNYLCKVFKENTGYTIMDYLNVVRIRSATKMICETDKKLVEISEEVGFKNIHHFNRVFKQIMNETPGKIRIQQKTSIYTDILAHGIYKYRYYEDN